jgi:hypothetical protein
LKNKQDIRFWLTTFVEEEAKITFEYKHFQTQIENNGCCLVKSNTDNVKIYTPELAAILISAKLTLTNMDSQKETIVNSIDYLKTFIKAYQKGEKYFENEFKVSPNTLYGVNAEQYVRDLHLNYFHVQHISSHQGWSYVKKSYPIILTHKAVKEFGYYSGIVNKVDEQIEKHPRLFEKFDKCDHDESNQHADRKSKQEQPITFDDLFIDVSLVSVCIDILKEVTPPLIDTECNYIGKSKGAFCVWINELTRQGLVKHYSDRKIYASLLPQRIGRFNIDESMFGKHHEKAENQYRTDIKTLVSKVKLSQISQKGKLGK